MIVVCNLIHPRAHIIHHLFRHSFVYIYIIQRIACGAMLEKMIQPWIYFNNVFAVMWQAVLQ